MGDASSGTCVKLIIKTPAKSDSVLTLQLDIDDDLSQVKKLISELYDGNPHPSEQTLIYAGQVLKDTSVKIRQVIAKVGAKEGPHSLHLVVRSKELRSTATSAAPEPSSVSSAPSSSAAPAPTPIPAPPVPAPVSEAPAPSASGTSPSEANPGPSAPQPTPPTPPTQPTPTTAQQPTAPPLQQQQYEMPPMYPQQYVYVNPIMAAAYHAAFTAAYQAAANMQAMQSYTGQLPAGPHPAGVQYRNPMPMYYNPYGAQQQAYADAFQQAQAMGAESSGAGAQAQAGVQYGGFMNIGEQNAFMMGQQQPVQQYAMVHMGRNGTALLRRRGAGAPGGNSGGGAANAAHGGAAAAPVIPPPPPVRRHHRVYRLRISARFLLQLFVIAVVLYQHFTWYRVLYLSLGGLFLWITTAWHPLRRIMAGVQAPPAPGAARQPNGQPAPRGLVAEIGMVVLGFFTSLLPAWNYDAQEAAAHLVAQEAAAREERERQGEAGEADPVAAVAAAVAAEDAAGAAPVPAADPAPPLAGDAAPAAVLTGGDGAA
eukprot:gene10166-8071_t